MPQGFGSNQAPDWGFGDVEPSPWDGVVRSWGFGDVAPLATLPVSIEGEAGQVFPDDGGEIVTLIAPWPAVGPYRVRLIASGGAAFPTGGFCTAPLVVRLGAIVARDNPQVCFTGAARRRLSFILPPLPVDLYSVEVTRNGEVTTLFNALRVVFRQRCIEDYRIRSAFPGNYTTGPRALSLERTTRPPHGPLEALTRSFGQNAQQLAGRPVTRLGADWTPGDVTVTLESALGWPTSGAFWLAGVRWTYEGINTTTGTLSDVWPSSRQFVTIAEGQEVVCDASAVEPS